MSKNNQYAEFDPKVLDKAKPCPNPKEEIRNRVLNSTTGK